MDISEAFACSFCSLFILGILLICILIPLSLQSVEYFEYGLLKKKTTGVTSGDVYDSGRYFNGPSYKFIKFDSIA